MKTLAVNRRARFDYEILDTLEAGIVLLGTEIKAVREGRGNISGSFARQEDGEMWLFNAHIAQYSAGGIHTHDPARPRKLLLHKQQLVRLSKQVDERGLTIVPLRLYTQAAQGKAGDRGGPRPPPTGQAPGDHRQGAGERGPRGHQERLRLSRTAAPYLGRL